MIMCALCVGTSLKGVDSIRKLLLITGDPTYVHNPLPNLPCTTGDWYRLMLMCVTLINVQGWKCLLKHIVSFMRCSCMHTCTHTHAHTHTCTHTHTHTYTHTHTHAHTPCGRKHTVDYNYCNLDLVMYGHNRSHNAVLSLHYTWPD